MGSSYIVLSLSVALTLLGLKFLYSGKWRKRALLPPGPPGRFIIGNLREFKLVHRWKVFTKWQELYGKCSMVYIKVLGRPIVILNDFESATEILTKQSMSTAGRPRLVMACELMGFDTATAPSQPNAFHKSMRRQMVPALNARTCADRHPIEVDERDALLQRLESKPQEFIQHLRQAVGSVVLRFSYGHRVLEDYDPLVELINQSLASVSVPLSGTYLVDVLPFLKYIPEWFPGARFKVQAREWAELRKQSIEVPFQEVRRSMEAGIVKPSFLQRLLEKRSSLNDWDSEEVQSMKYAAGSLYSAGSDTTVSALSTFLLAMTLFPEKQRKAQLELDRVLGRGRVPDFQDQESLPYVSSLIKEVLRWYPVLPLAIAHTCTEDITHNGYLISKGTTLVPNVWAMSRDASVYPAPDEFLPERFLPRSIGGLHDVPARDPAEFIFGFGRRLCPGRMLATESLWLFAASILAVFDIAPPMDDKTGHPVVPQGTYGNGAIVHPDPFKCDIKRRQRVPNA